MKKAITLLLALLLVLTLAACGGNTAAPGGAQQSGGSQQTQEVYKFRFSLHDPAIALRAQLFQQWCDDIAEATGGAVQIEMFTGGTLAGPENIIDAINGGVCDMGWIAGNYYAEMFPLADIIQLPMLGVTSPEQIVNVMWDLYEEFPEMQANYDRYQVMTMCALPISYLHFADKEVNSLEGISGLKIRAAGSAVIDYMTLCGAVPISMH